MFRVAPPMTVDADPTEFMDLDVEYPDLHQDFKFDDAASASMRAEVAKIRRRCFRHP